MIGDQVMVNRPPCGYKKHCPNYENEKKIADRLVFLVYPGKQNLYHPNQGKKNKSCGNC
jgi:hypothetical protein